jgi:tetratricopeptide (TPR) repeat protein
MHELLMPHESARSERDGWMDDNTRGLSLAAAAEWDEAAEAFAAAADVLARRAPDVSSHDALALILGNLAQACFRAGRTDDALQHAQRACALRVALTGEDAMPVARARMDLAVMLGAAGRLDEAQALLQRAIAAVELHVGDEDARLVVMLENAARLALAAGAPANAEPLLLRLHALLDLYGMSTDRADRLLAMVAGVRARAEATRADADRTEVAVYAHASIDEHEAQEDWDDQPLRDAVAITGVLLRTTPSGVIAIPEPVNHDAQILAAFETVVDTPVAPMIDLVDELPMETVDIALDLADDFGLPMPADSAPSMALGFTVEHGLAASHTPAPVLDASTDLMGLELDDALADSMVDVPTHRPSLALDHAAPPRVEAAAPVVPEPFSALNAPLRQPVRHVEPPMAHGFGPPPPALVTPGARSEQAPAPPSMPTARDMTRAQDAQDAADADQSSAQAAVRSARTGRTPMSDRHRKEERGSRVGLIVAGVGAAVAAGGAAWYFLLR